MLTYLTHITLIINLYCRCLVFRRRECIYKTATTFFLKKNFLIDLRLSCIFGHNLLSVMFPFVILGWLYHVSSKKKFFLTPQVCGINSLD